MIAGICLKEQGSRGQVLERLRAVLAQAFSLAPRSRVRLVDLPALTAAPDAALHADQARDRRVHYAATLCAPQLRRPAGT